VFGLGRVFDGIDFEWFERKVKLFGLEYIRVNLREKFIEVCEWYDDCKNIYISIMCKM